MKQEPAKYGMYIAGNARTVEALAKGILDVMKVPHVDNATKVAAIQALERAGAAQPVSIVGAHISL